MTPKAVQTHLKYICPECSCEQWLLDDEAIQIGAYICFCGIKIKIKPIKHIKVTPVWATSSPILPEEAQSNATQLVVSKVKQPIKEPIKQQEEVWGQIQDDCSEALKVLGYKKGVAKEKVVKLFKEKEYTEVEDFLKDMF